MLSRRSLLKSAATGVACAPFATAAFAAAPSPGLSAHARAKNLVYGCATSTYQLKDPLFVAALKREAALLVPEYELKRDKIEAVRKKLDFSAPDALLGFARVNKMRLRGHTLVWHAANPPWLEPEVLSSRNERLFTDYVTAVMTHYRGAMSSFDVVNEALLAASPRKDGLRESLWLKAFGPGYIDTAFHAAHQADPACLLVYNDWGCEAAGPENDRMRAITLEFLSKALARKVPIGAYGMQGHLGAFDPPIDQKKLRQFLDDLRSLGLRVIVTEHDVYDTGGSLDIAVRDRAVADASARFLDVVLGNNAVDAVLTWGLSDKYIDPLPLRERLAGYDAPRRLPLDRAMQRKPLWQAMATAFDRA